MNRKLVLLICMALLALAVQADIKLKKQGTATQLLVDGQPMPQHGVCSCLLGIHRTYGGKV